jgi:membrane associated rhomboid family serine protease
MKTWLRRIRGAIGMGVTWADAGSAVGVINSLGFVVRTGSRPDAPFPIMLGALGFVAGVLSAGVLMVVEGRRRFDQMSLPRFAAGGAAVGLALSAIFFLAVSRGDPAFLQYFLLAGPVAAAVAAGCAAGSLALARRWHRRELLDTPEDGTAVGRRDEESRKALRNGR